MSSRDNTLDGLFRVALEAIDAGDVNRLNDLVTRHPEIAYERLKTPGSWLRDQIGRALESFFNRPYLLWLVTEDAPRTHRLAPNVGAIARTIVRAARAKPKVVQPLLDSSLHFAICAPVGRDDGSQRELIDALVDEGASMDGTPVQALICHNPGAAEHLLKRGAPLQLGAAACLDRWDDLERLARAATASERQMAVGLAALNGRAEGLRQLIPFGFDPRGFTTGFYTHATPLHHAVWSGRLDAVKALVDGGAALDIRDKGERATPLGWAEYAASQPRGTEEGRQYGEIAAYLRTKGAPE